MSKIGQMGFMLISIKIYDSDFLILMPSGTAFG